MTSIAESQDIYMGFPFEAEPRYDLSDIEVTELTKDLLKEHTDTLPKDMPFTCVRIKGTSPYANLARNIEGKIFTEELHDDPQRMAADFEPYEDASYFFLVIDTEKSLPTGTLRIIEDGPNGFMTINELLNHVNPGETAPQRFFNHAVFYPSFNNKAKDYGDRGINITPGNTWEVGTIAVLPEYRRGINASQEQTMISYIVSGLLYRSLYAGAVNNGIEGFLSIIDPAALATLRGLGIPFDDIPGTSLMKFDDGSEFQPCYAVVQDFDFRMRSFAQHNIDIAETEKDRQRAIAKQAMIDVLLTGNALDDMMAYRYNYKPNSVI